MHTNRRIVWRPRWNLNHRTLSVVSAFAFYDAWPTRGWGLLYLESIYRPRNDLSTAGVAAQRVVDVAAAHARRAPAVPEPPARSLRRDTRRHPHPHPHHAREETDAVAVPHAHHARLEHDMKRATSDLIAEAGSGAGGVVPATATVAMPTAATATAMATLRRRNSDPATTERAPDPRHPDYIGHANGLFRIAGHRYVNAVRERVPDAR